MSVRYDVRRGHPFPWYSCQRRTIQRGESPCQSIPGSDLDATVSEALLAAVTPAALDVALEVFEELRARGSEIDRLRRIQVERVREEAELAQRQFLLVRPENRLVADALEREWNEKLARLREAEDSYREASASRGGAIDPADRARIQALVSDLPRVWHDPRTAMRDRKRMLRLLVEDVTLMRTETIQIHIRWKGGTTTSLERPRALSAPDLRRTPVAIVEMIRALATEKTDHEIGLILNARTLRTGTGQPFTRLLVRNIRTTYGIASLADHLRQNGWLTAAEIAAQLNVHYATAKRFGAEGVLRAIRADDRSQILFEPIIGPLPTAHPGKRFKDRRQFPKCVSNKRKEMQCEA